MDSTAHLLSTPANVKKLMESIAQDKAGVLVQSFPIEEIGRKTAQKRKTSIRKKS